MPELAVLEASPKGYDYLAISEIIIEESWALLDYLLILELVRRCQQHLHEHFTLGHAFVRGTLERLNRHRKVNENTRDNEFQIFFDFDKTDLFRFDRSLLERDPYDLADEISDEEQERTGLHEHLHSIGAERLVICGLQSEYCVEMTTRRAFNLGYGITLVADGHST